VVREGNWKGEVLGTDGKRTPQRERGTGGEKERLNGGEIRWNWERWEVEQKWEVWGFLRGTEKIKVDP